MGIILLVRHGQASFGADDYDQLSDLGHEQARVLGAALRPRLRKLGAVVTGTLRRHRQTADDCLAALGTERPVIVEPAFDEFDHEDVVARLEPRYRDKAVVAAELASSPEPRRAFQQLFSRAMERWAGGDHDADYTESWTAFRRRCATGLDRVSQTLGGDETALVFTSGGPIGVILASVLPVPPQRAFELQFRLVNCGISKLLAGSRGVSFGSLNEQGHFEHEGRRLVTHG